MGILALHRQVIYQPKAGIYYNVLLQFFHWHIHVSADLQQAEAQAREAQIEAALERVRSRTLAMQKS